MSATVASLEAAVSIMGALAEAIREVVEIPSGELYAMLCGRLTIDEYRAAIRILKRADLVHERGHVLRWVGPTIP